MLATMMVAATAPAVADPAKLAPGCMSGAPSGLETYWKALCASPPQDVTLHRMRAGQAAFAAGFDRQAEEQFDAVLAAIEAIYAESESAAKARSVWHAEKVKDFKGEPYERVMAYYYRGLLYLMAGDWDNAQASFKGGVLQDSFAELERFRSDVASLVWLEGWARRCQGSEAAATELFAEAANLRPALKPPAPDATLLVVAEAGIGPRKLAAGREGEKLLIREGSHGNDQIVAAIGGRKVDMVEAEDLFFQATTRGGREMDNILAEKAATKTGARNAGSAAIVAGTAMMAGAGAPSNNNNQSSGARTVGAAGGVVALIGLVVAASAAAMHAEVDIRTWDTLPHSIYLAALPPASANAGPDRVELLDGSGQSIIGGRARLRTASTPVCSLAWAGNGTLMPSRMIEAPTQPEVPPAGRPTCRTPSGAEKSLAVDICRRIGGTPLE